MKRRYCSPAWAFTRPSQGYRIFVKCKVICTEVATTNVCLHPIAEIVLGELNNLLKPLLKGMTSWIDIKRV